MVWFFSLSFHSPCIPFRYLFIPLSFSFPGFLLCVYPFLTFTFQPNLFYFLPHFYTSWRVGGPHYGCLFFFFFVLYNCYLSDCTKWSQWNLGNRPRLLCRTTRYTSLKTLVTIDSVGWLFYISHVMFWHLYWQAKLKWYSSNIDNVFPGKFTKK